MSSSQLSFFGDKAGRYAVYAQQMEQLGYGEDPLNQRSSCGWKATSVAVRLCEEYMVRIESLSPVWSKKVKAN